MKKLRGIVNVDYILYLYQEGDELVLDSYPIDNSIGEEIIDRVCELNGEDVTVMDLQEEFETFLPQIEFWKKGYCFDDEDYDIVDYTAIQGPIILTKNKYTFLINKARREAEKLWFVENDGKKLSALSKEERIAREEYIDFEISEYRESLKDHFIKSLSGFIPAINYEVTLHILRQKHPDILFSHDYKGFSWDRWFKPAKDIEIAPKTNIVFGKSSYFLLVLKYKGIHILPYAETIEYSIEDAVQQIRYFRKYKPNRSEWINVMEETSSLFEEIRKNGKDFINKYIHGPLKKMKAELKQINETNDSTLFITEREQLLNPYSRFDTGHVRKERIMEFYKIIHISDALLLIDNLVELNRSGIAKTDTYRDYILSLNKQLLPSISRFEKKTASALKKVRTEIVFLNHSDKDVKEELEERRVIESNLREVQSFLRRRKDMLLGYLG